MKIVWLFPPSEEGDFPNISQYRFFKRMPIRVSIIYPYLAASGVTLLNKAGFDIDFFDCPTMELDWDPISPKLVNADLVIMEARTPIMPYIWETCQALRLNFPDTKIILYGDHVSWNPEESLPYCDHIVCGGDFDDGILTLACLINQGITPPKVYQKPLMKNLDNLPFVDRELVPWQLYYEAWRHREKFVWTMSSRGCYYHCTFCAWAKTFWENRIRYRSPKNVADEYEMLYNQLGECEVLDDADLFDTNWGRKFAEELDFRGFSQEQILWAFQTHPNMISNLKTLRFMRKVGLITVKLGIETGNQKTLNLIKKETTVMQIERAISLLKEADIMVHANLMVGWPWETKQEAYHTIEWIKKLNPNQAQFSLVIPYPNTEIYDYAKENGLLLVGDRDWASYDAGQSMMRMEGMTSEEVVKLYQDCWKQFYFNLKYMWYHLKKVRHFHGFKQLYRGYRSIAKGHLKAVK